jgi:hypothetical protein
MHSLHDEKGSVRLLEAALERDPLNLRAAEHLVELYRARDEDQELAGIIRARAALLHDRYVKDPPELPRAALAFEKLSSVYEAIGDSASAIAALRTALELERQRQRHTLPSPPPEAPPESSFRAVPGGETRAPQNAAPAPEPPWSAGPAPESRDPSRDTMRSPVPAIPLRGAARLDPQERVSTEPPTLPPPPPLSRQAAEPLLAVIEALHALRRSEDVVAGAALVLKTALAAIPSFAGFVHVSDIATRDFVVVATSDDSHAGILGTRVNESDLALRRALRAMQAITIDAAELVEGRWQMLRPERTVLCAPVQYDGRHLGAIELIDPTTHGTFTEADRHAMTYVGERFGEFLADRSIAFPVGE